MSTPIVVMPGSSGIYDHKANVKVHSYNTSIALPIYQLLSAASHRSITAFQIKTNLTFMWYRNPVHRNFCAGHCSAEWMKAQFYCLDHYLDGGIYGLYCKSRICRIYVLTLEIVKYDYFMLQYSLVCIVTCKTNATTPLIYITVYTATDDVGLLSNFGIFDHLDPKRALMNPSRLSEHPTYTDASVTSLICLSTVWVWHG